MLTHLAGIMTQMLHFADLMSLKASLFMHIPKTAGTSIIDLARMYYGRGNVISHGDYIDKQPQELIGAAFISGHFGYEYASKLMKERFSFTFLRDPVDRILSSYYFCLTRDPDEFPEYKLAQENSLDRYLELVNESKQSGVWNCQTRLLAHSWKSVPEFSENELVDLAVRHLDDFSHVGFTETFDEDMEVVVGKLGFVGAKHIKKSNVTKVRGMYGELPSYTKKLLDRASELDRHVYEHAWARRRSRP